MESFSNNLNSYLRQVSQGIKQVKNLSFSAIGKVFSLMGKWEKILALALILVALASAITSVALFYYHHTVPAKAQGGIYTEGLVGQPTYINPLLATSQTDLDLTKLVFSGLYKYDSSGKLVADLADGMPTISDDQKQYTINLKKNATWHNGKQVTADDIIFTIQLLQDPSYKSPLRGMWLSTSIVKLSDYSVQFTTKDISGPFLKNLTLPILPKSIWGAVDGQNFLTSKRNLEAVGSGPYAIKEIKKEPSGKIDQITLSSFDSFYNGPANIDTLVIHFYDTQQDALNALHSREVAGYAYVALNSDTFLDQNQDQLQTVVVPLPQYQVLFFNLNNKILSEQAVRQALQLATDKQQIIQDVFKGNAILPNSPFLFAWQQAISVNGYNLEQAKKTLADAGWQADPKTNILTKKNVPLRLTLTTNNSLADAKAAENLANQWRKLGADVTVNIQTTQELTQTAIHNRSFDALLFPQKFGADPDPFLFWHSSQVKDPGFNLTGFADAQADQLITQARTTTDQNEREQDYQKFNDLFTAKVPAIFLNQTILIYALDKKIQNVGIDNLYDPSQRFYDLQSWFVATKRVWK